MFSSKALKCFEIRTYSNPFWTCSGPADIYTSLTWYSTKIFYLQRTFTNDFTNLFSKMNRDFSTVNRISVRFLQLKLYLFLNKLRMLNIKFRFWQPWIQFFSHIYRHSTLLRSQIIGQFFPLQLYTINKLQIHRALRICPVRRLLACPGAVPYCDSRI